MGFCLTMHWQTSGRLVQELNVCTVQKQAPTIRNQHPMAINHLVSLVPAALVRSLFLVGLIAMTRWRDECRAVLSNISF